MKKKLNLNHMGFKRKELLITHLSKMRPHTMSEPPNNADSERSL